MRRLTLLLAALSLLLVACDRGGSGSRADATAEAGTPTATATSTAAATSEVTISVADPAEGDRIRAALAGMPAGIEVSDQPSADGKAYVAEVWAAVTDQRRDVLELTLDDLRRVLTGEVTDWADLGGSPQPIAVELPGEEAEAIAAKLAPAGLGAGVVKQPLADVLADVETQPGTLAVVPVEELRAGVLAPVVDGHDPYRDAASASPLRVDRWIKGPNEAVTNEVAQRLGWNASLAAFNPAGLLATGDYIPARCAWSSAVAAGGPEHILAAPGMRDLLRAADLTVIPLEVGLMTSNPPTPCVSTTVLQGPASAVEALTDAGVDVVTRASNHALDCWGACSGILVMQETDEVLRQAGIPSAGLANDSAAARTATVVERGGIRFGFLAYDDIAPWYHATPSAAGTAGLDLATLADDVRAAKALADHVVVAIHAGIEYQAEPVERQREAARIAIEAGASLVIGNHPHWVQATEQIGEGFVVYALGNFVFDQPWSVPTQEGMLLEAGFTKERLLGYRLRPHIIRDEYQPTLLDPAGEGAHILERVWEASDLISGR
jgi:hypothetical protein